MNRWKNIFVVGTWIFLGALVADTVNITDLFPSISTIHTDEDIGCGGNSIDFPMTQAPLTPQHSHPSSHSQKKNSATKTNTPQITIFDQDSPCVAAVSFTSIVPSFLFADENAHTCANPVTGETLYLKLCTLLI